MSLIAFGVAGRPICGPFRAYILLGGSVAERGGRSSGSTSSSASTSGGGFLGDIWLGWGISGPSCRFARDFRRSSSSRAACSFFRCLSSFICRKSPACSVDAARMWDNAGKASPASLAVSLRRLSGFSRRLTAGELRLWPTLLLCLALNSSWACMAFLKSSSSSDPW
jgi:hypothetical protein